MSFDEGNNDKQWKCGKGGSVNLQKVSSIVRDIGEPCLHQSPIKVVIQAINTMLKPDKWQTMFDSDGKIFGFQKVLKLIIHGGVDPSIRAEVWEFLLGCYGLSTTTEYRTQLRTARRYFSLIQTPKQKLQPKTRSTWFEKKECFLQVCTHMLKLPKGNRFTEAAEITLQIYQSHASLYRERYRNLLNQCQTMHSSIGTGSLAYPVGSKVMDMRLSSKDEESKDGEFPGGQISEATINKIDDTYVSDVDKSYKFHKQSYSDCSDLVSVRGSTGACDCSDLRPYPDQYNSTSSNDHRTNESKFPAESYLDFAALSVTDLFKKNVKEKRAHTRRKLRYEERRMHSFQINNNADLVVESNCHPRSEITHADIDESFSQSNIPGCEKEMINRVRMSDAPETEVTYTVTSQAGGSEDKVSEWLWTLHRIVVDVVRTDSHLDFYEDTKNVARMSDILAVYAWVDPATGYCQGMSDLLSPFVVLFEDNADAFWCFEMLIRRMRENFKMEGPTGVMKQLQALWHILELTDKEVFSHLSHIGAESLHFAFRMLLVLFRRELSFNEALCMWEMIWAADFDLSLTCLLEENCPDILAIQLPGETVAESGEESLKSKAKSWIVERSISDNSVVRSSSVARPFCGLTKTFWSRNDRAQFPAVVSSTRNGDDELPVFCVAAILIINRQKILKETNSFDDLIKIFNDNMLEIRVKKCVRTAIKLRKKYFYKLIRNRSTAQEGS